MRINKPLTKEQLEQGDLIPPGIYDFQVVDAQEKISKSGAEMIALQLKIFMPDGRVRVIFDYLLEALEYKFGHFAEATGLLPKYQEGYLNAEDCFDKCGKCKIYIQKDKTGEYGDKSAVADYIPTDDVAAKKLETKIASAKQEIDPNFNDEVLPF